MLRLDLASFHSLILDAFIVFLFFIFKRQTYPSGLLTVGQVPLAPSADLHIGGGVKRERPIFENRAIKLKEEEEEGII